MSPAPSRRHLYVQPVPQFPPAPPGNPNEPIPSMRQRRRVLERSRNREPQGVELAVLILAPQPTAYFVNLNRPQKARLPQPERKRIREQRYITLSEISPQPVGNIFDTPTVIQKARLRLERIRKREPRQDLLSQLLSPQPAAYFVDQPNRPKRRIERSRKREPINLESLLSSAVVAAPFTPAPPRKHEAARQPRRETVAQYLFELLNQPAAWFMSPNVKQKPRVPMPERKRVRDPLNQLLMTSISAIPFIPKLKRIPEKQRPPRRPTQSQGFFTILSQPVAYFFTHTPQPKARLPVQDRSRRREPLNQLANLISFVAGTKPFVPVPSRVRERQRSPRRPTMAQYLFELLAQPSAFFTNVSNRPKPRLQDKRRPQARQALTIFQILTTPFAPAARRKREPMRMADRAAVQPFGLVRMLTQVIIPGISPKQKARLPLPERKRTRERRVDTPLLVQAQVKPFSGPTGRPLPRQKSERRRLREQIVVTIVHLLEIFPNFGKGRTGKVAQGLEGTAVQEAPGGVRAAKGGVVSSVDVDGSEGTIIKPTRGTTKGS